MLRALEKRLLRNGERSRVRDACAAELQPPNVPLADHGALLALSQDKQGRVRLLTTNFDTVFERAAHDSGRAVASHAVKALPKPAGMTDHGILHLHGRLADPSPSAQDVAMTLELVAALRPLKITVHDHLVIGRQGHSSLRALRLI